MNTVYRDSTHFNEETFIQAKIFNMSVNTYRKGIAKRYGYKSSKLFKDFLDNFQCNENDSNVEFEKRKENEQPSYLNRPFNRVWDMEKKAWGGEWIPDDHDSH